MQLTREIEERLAIVRQYETDCYSICHYVLQGEREACEAAEQALRGLLESDAFFAADPRGRMELLRKQSLKSALGLKMHELSRAARLI
jgi:hypothetical protein